MRYRKKICEIILSFLIMYSCFRKFVRFYYNYITKSTIAKLKIIENNPNIDSDNFIKRDAQFVEFSRQQVTKSAIAYLEKNLAFIPEYNPPLKIMPLGDSITYGIIGTNDKDSGGYRTELWNKFVADGLNVEFVGSQSNASDNLINKCHEGYPGWTISQLASTVNKHLNFFQPDVILLMIGTNDTRKNSLEIMLNEFSNLIDKITTQLPNAQLLIASIPPVHPTVKPAIRGIRAMYFNIAIPRIIKLKISQGKKIHFVDMSSLTTNDLTSSLSLDLDNGLHPHAQGYSKIANLWHDAVLKVISNHQIAQSAIKKQLVII